MFTKEFCPFMIFKQFYDFLILISGTSNAKLCEYITKKVIFIFPSCEPLKPNQLTGG